MRNESLNRSGDSREIWMKGLPGAYSDVPKSLDLSFTTPASWQIREFPGTAVLKSHLTIQPLERPSASKDLGRRGPGGGSVLLGRTEPTSSRPAKRCDGPIRRHVPWQPPNEYRRTFATGTVQRCPLACASPRRRPRKPKLLEPKHQRPHRRCPPWHSDRTRSHG